MGLFKTIATGLGSFLGGPVGGALAAGATDLIGGVMQNNSAKDAAQNQQQFQENMSNTSYQRAMADMKAAGLNPMLAYQQGGASTPQGSSYQPVNVASSAVHSATSAAGAVNQSTLARANYEQIKSATDLNRDLSVKAMQDANKSVAETHQSQKQAELNSAQAKKVDAETLALRYRLPAIAKEGRSDYERHDFIGDAIKGGKSILDSLPSVLQNSAKSVKNYMSDLPRGILAPPKY